MRTAKKTASALLLALGLGACMTTAQDVMNTWLGTTDANLMASWGAPDRESIAGGGFRVLTYLTVREDDDGRRHVCRSSFTVDADHRIAAATYYCG
jgi:hypothetical protein